MKKMFFLMLALLIWGTASMNAQVRIGGETTPHQSAVLDLNAADNVDNGALGLALPRVSDFPASPTKGLVVYSTGAEPGLYVWDGSKWTAIKTCTLPATPTTIIFNPAFKDVPDAVNVNTIVTATISPVVGATSYTWNIPDGVTVQGLTNGKQITLRATTLGNIDGSQFSVIANNDCGSSQVKVGEGLLNVQNPTVVPATPTFTIARTFIDLNGTTTISCTDVGADGYAWELPTGLISTTSLGIRDTTTTNSLEIKGITDGKYYDYNTGGMRLRVNAFNTIGRSNYRNATGDTIYVGNATAAPIIDSVPTFRNVRSVGARIEVTPRIISSGSTSYNWTVPAGLQAINGTSDNTIVLRTVAQGTIDPSTLKLTVTNSMGSVTSGMKGSLVVAGDGHPGPDLVVGPNEYHPEETFTYKTWVYPGNVGTWMITNSKEGTPTYTTYEGHTEGERGYYYDRAAATDIACPTGWAVPTSRQASILQAFFGQFPENTAWETWRNADLYPGNWLYNGGWAAWDTQGRFWLSDAGDMSRMQYSPTLNYLQVELGDGRPGYGWSLRCRKID
jgi:uncharacterized protein (TIGR02145 family)